MADICHTFSETQGIHHQGVNLKLWALGDYDVSMKVRQLKN